MSGARRGMVLAAGAAVLPDAVLRLAGQGVFIRSSFPPSSRKPAWEETTSEETCRHARFVPSMEGRPPGERDARNNSDCINIVPSDARANSRTRPHDGARAARMCTQGRARPAHSSRYSPRLSGRRTSSCSSPPGYGGYEMPIGMMVEVAGELCRGCGSSAWIFPNLAVPNWIIGSTNRRRRRRCGGSDPDALAWPRRFPPKAVAAATSRAG